MRRRVCFVSNSSSSSFVMIVTKKGHKAALEQLNVYERAVVEKVMKPDEIFGHKVMVFGELSVMDYGVFEDLNLEWRDEFDGLDEDGPSEAFYRYQELLPEGSVVFTWEDYDG